MIKMTKIEIEMEGKRNYTYDKSLLLYSDKKTSTRVIIHY